MPWGKHRSRSRKGDFYKGAFDSIPFLNDDAKRTFVHLLLRPGYMIRDYIQGQHERYLAPLTSLIIFYAFFALVSSVVNPDYRPADKPEAGQVQESAPVVSDPVEPADTLKNAEKIQKATKIAINLDSVIDLLDLDRHPEKIDSPAKASPGCIGRCPSEPGNLSVPVRVFVPLVGHVPCPEEKEDGRVCLRGHRSLCPLSVLFLHVLLPLPRE